MSFTRFLDRSLVVLEAEAALAYRAVVQTLEDRSVNVTVDQETVAIRVVKRRLVTSPPLEMPTTVARTSRRALVRLLSGEQSLMSAILDDEVFLLGALDDLAALHDALLCYFRGAVRSPGFPALLDEFLGPKLNEDHLSLGAP